MPEDKPRSSSKDAFASAARRNVRSQWSKWHFKRLLLLGFALGIHGQVHGGDVFKGAEVYKNYCQSCHGSNGRSQMPGIPDFSRGKGLMRSDENLFESIRAGKNAMPGYRGILSEEDTLDVISYLRTFF